MVHTSSIGSSSLSLRALLAAVTLAAAVVLLPTAALADDTGDLLLAVEDDAGAGEGEADAAAGGGGVGLGIVAAIVLMGLAFRQVSSRD